MKGDNFPPPSRLEDLSERREGEVRLARVAAAADDDAIGARVGNHLARTDSGKAVEEGDGARGAATGDDGEEAVDRAYGGGLGLLEQFVEQAARVPGINVAGMVPV
jgi:hypothetical protein